MSTSIGLSEREQEQAEEVAAVYRTVAIAVTSAAVASLALAIVLLRLDLTSSAKASGFVLFITGCAAAHILLWLAYRRGDIQARCGNWRVWGWAFALVSFCEGLGWGWSPVAFANSFDGECLCLLVTVAVAAGSVAAFGPYRPAFFALFLTSSVPFAIHVTLSPLPIQRGEGVLMILYLIGIGTFGFLTNRSFRRLVRLRLNAERLAAQLERQIAVTEAANRAKSSFLAAASHDLRQPVHALGLLVGALHCMTLSDDVRDIVERIDASTQALDGLFAALLDISRLDAAVVAVHRRPFAITPMIDRIVDDHRAEAAAKGIKLVSHRSSVTVLSDPVHVERVVRNLVSNAVRYTAFGRVVVGCRRTGASIRVEVWDTGPGIAASHRERIFEEYYQIGNAERDRGKGLGLGLAIVRRLANLLEAPLHLRSTEGCGSCFSIELPMSKTQPSPIIETRDTISQGHHTIVVIDDEPEIRIAITLLLSRWGKTVIAAGSGAEALERLAACPVRPDLLICDFRLREGETGLEVVQLLRSEFNTEIPAILVTGETSPERLVAANDSGLVVLHKPISDSRLRAVIAHVLSNQAKIPGDARSLCTIDDV